MADRNEMQTRHEKLKGKRGWLHQNPTGPNRETARKEERARIRKLREIEREERQRIRQRQSKKIRKARERDQRKRARLNKKRA